MCLHEVVKAQKGGEARGIPSICSAHPWVIRTAMRMGGDLLIESTCNQVNQYGGYTGMRPEDFVRHIQGFALESGFPVERIAFGGDHLGPGVWGNEAGEQAMQKACVLIDEYVRAGYQKLHLDCSMRMADDPPGALDPAVSARRTARLAKVAEEACVEGRPLPRYVIGSEVPPPGGATRHEAPVRVTCAEDVQRTIDITHQAFQKEGVEAAWERVVAVVVQPGVEFGDDHILDYDPQAARGLSKFIENTPWVYEAHSTDYQNQTALSRLVRDHFAILKVGPALTFAYREAVFALAMMENEIFAAGQRSNLIQVLEEEMLNHPEHWQKYYHGSPERLAYSRKFSLSDRIRYYWFYPRVQQALEKLVENLSRKEIPLAVWSQFAPDLYELIRSKQVKAGWDALVTERIGAVLRRYRSACGISQA